MALQPLSVDGVPFTQLMTVDHSVTSLFVLPEGSFYTVETLVLDPVTGVPLRPLVDYMYFQQVPEIGLETAKQVAAIIQIRNKNITSVVVKGYYTHGVTSEQLANWNMMTTLYKDVPLWMNWIACLDDVLQVHPNVKRTVTEPPMDKRTLSDVEVELNYIAAQSMNGDSLYLSHIEFWQKELFDYIQRMYDQSNADLKAYLDKMKVDLVGKIGDFKFTAGDGLKWSGGIQNEYRGVLLMDRGNLPLGSYIYKPQGSAIPSTRTRLFNRVAAIQDIEGVLTTNKQQYFQTDVMQIQLNVTKLTNRVYPDAHIQVVDPDTNKLIAEFEIKDIKVGLYNFQLNLQSSIEMEGFNKSLIVRVSEYLWIQPSIIVVTPSGDPMKGYIAVEMLGLDNVGNVTGGGYVNQILCRFKRVGVLTEPVRLYIRVDGNYPDGTLASGYYPFRFIDFQPNFDRSDVIVAKFTPKGSELETYRVNVSVSKAEDPNNQTAIVNSNVWYIAGVPINPYINWYYATLANGQYTRVSSVEEGNDVYVIGNLSVDKTMYTTIPRLSVVSKGVGAAVEGVDFVIDHALIEINNDTIAYKVKLPFKPEQETKYKYLQLKTINSNVGELWIVDKVAPMDITADWHLSPSLGSPIAEYVDEKSTFYLHIKAPALADGTVLTVSLATPEMYRPYLTIPGSTTVYGGICVVKIVLDAPLVSNPVQYIKMLVVGPNINYTTVGLAVMDTALPYYELRYVVAGLEYALTAYPGQSIQCQARCIRDPNTTARATLMMAGTAFTNGANSDVVLPEGKDDILLSRVLTGATTAWIPLFVSGVTIKEPMRLDHLTITTNVVFPTDANGLKQGRDTSALLNLRKSL